MSLKPDPLGRQALRYFAMVNASVSHELKNVLAILNEQAGLLEDLSTMAEGGQPLDPDRIRRLATNMQGQIGRGDDIVKRMNRFAHSADSDRASVDLNQLVILVVELFGRIATNRGVEVVVQPAASAITVNTDPFSLETLLGTMLYRLTDAAPGIDRLEIRLTATTDTAQIRLRQLDHQPVTALLASDTLKVLLAALQATAVFHQDNGELCIMLPGDIDV